jgi:hypothetical protein
MRSSLVLLFGALMLASSLLAVVLFKHLSYPLFWADEAETAMMGRRILEVGYPYVHGPKGTVYSLWHQGAIGIDEATDAYTGSAWAQFYVAAIGEVFAAGSDDPYRKTAWHRLPFALSGFIGLIVLGLGVLPSLPGPNRKLLFSTAYALLLAYSVSLILHLREVRYYGLVVLVGSGILLVFFRRNVFGTLGRVGYGVWIVLLLFLLFNVFYPAFTVFGIAIAVYHAVRIGAGPGSWRARASEWMRAVLPLLVAVAAVLPLLTFFDFVEQGRSWTERFGFDAYLPNLAFVFTSLLRHDFLAPALALRVAALALRPARAVLEESQAQRQRLEIASFLFQLIVIYAVFIAQLPFLFERYFIVLSPLVILLLLLDAFSVYDFVRAAPRADGTGRNHRLRLTRRIGRVAGLVSLACFAGSVWIRAPEFASRLYEVTHRYQGPLDFVIPYLAAKYPEAQDLVIATNYEGGAYQYYLDSHVTVGFYAMRLERDMGIQPDVIIPRPWSEQLEELRTLSERVSYESTRFPVENLHWNNLPALSPRATRSTAHRFRTPVPVDGGRPPLVVLERSASPASEPPGHSGSGRGGALLR